MKKYYSPLNKTSKKIYLSFCTKYINGLLNFAIFPIISLAVIFLLLFLSFYEHRSNSINTIKLLIEYSISYWLLNHVFYLNIFTQENTKFIFNFTLIPIGSSFLFALFTWRKVYFLNFCFYKNKIEIFGNISGYLVFTFLISFFSKYNNRPIDILKSSLISFIYLSSMFLIIHILKQRKQKQKLIIFYKAQKTYNTLLINVVKLVFSICILTLLFSSLLLLVNLIINWKIIISVYEMLQMNLFGNIIFTILQITYIPNLVVWILAWSSGSGFNINSMLTTPFHSYLEIIPSIPILMAMPLDISFSSITFLNKNIIKLITSFSFLSGLIVSIFYKNLFKFKNKYILKRYVYFLFIKIYFIIFTTFIISLLSALILGILTFISSGYIATLKTSNLFFGSDYIKTSLHIMVQSFIGLLFGIYVIYICKILKNKR